MSKLTEAQIKRQYRDIDAQNSTVVEANTLDVSTLSFMHVNGPAMVLVAVVTVVGLALVKTFLG